MTDLSDDLATHVNLAAASALAQSERGGQAAVTVILARDGRWLATGMYPHVDGHDAPLRALGRLSVALGADQAVTMWDAFVRTVPESEVDMLTDRPRDDPRAEEALLIVLADHEGAQGAAVMRYVRGDDGRLTADPSEPCGVMPGSKYLRPRRAHRRESVSAQRALAACDRAGVRIMVPGI